MRYRKKPVVIRAHRVTAENRLTLIEWIGNAQAHDDGILVETLEGTMLANFGDWIIQGVKGEFYPCKPDIFEATYEPAEEDEEDLFS